MRIRIGYEIVHVCPQPTPLIVTLNVHYSRVSDLETPDHVRTEPTVPIEAYRDGFGNWCGRLVAPTGRLRIHSDTVIRDSGLPDAKAETSEQHAIEALPIDALEFLQGSRYCETDRLMETAWTLFGSTPPGWPRVQAICDYVHRHITFGYEHARGTRTALEAFEEGRGVCRDYAHLAIALCRCMNVPARYCTGYLGDIGVPLSPDPMDFSAYFEAYLGSGWYVFDPRNNQARVGRILIARGRDAADVPISTAFGPNVLESFRVWTDELR